MSQEHGLQQRQALEEEVKGLKVQVNLQAMLIRVQEQHLELLRDRLKEREGHIGFLEQTLQRLNG